MNEIQKRQIRTLRESGKSYSEIAKTIGLESITAIRMYCSRQNIKPNEIHENHCLQCGKLLKTAKTGRTRKFCSDICRLSYWKENTSKAINHNKTCPACGSHFITYKPLSKYCCHSCYINARFKGATL